MKKIFYALFLTNLISLSSVYANNTTAGSFSKIDKTAPKNILSESKTQQMTPDAWLQPVKGRSLESLRLMMGTSLNTKSVGPSMNAEWTLKLSQKSPFSLASGVGYFVETKNNPKGSSRNFHNLPLYAAASYQQRFYKNLRFNLNAGPVLRLSFERGIAREENKSYSYGDLIAGAGVDYEWLNSLTGDGRSIGLRLSRLFGISNKSESSGFDSLLASFSFDL